MIRLFAGEEPIGRMLAAPVDNEHLPKRFGEHHLPVFVTFASTDPDDAAFTIQIGHFQTRDFRHTKASGVHGRQRCSLFKAPGSFEQGFYF